MDVIKRHLKSDDRQKHLEDDEKPITADEIELDVTEDVKEDVQRCCEIMQGYGPERYVRST